MYNILTVKNKLIKKLNIMKKSFLLSMFILLNTLAFSQVKATKMENALSAECN
jgi:hypothetical protein